MPAGDPLSYALAAEQNLEKLATELGKLGADDGTIEGISSMADSLREVVAVLGEGQHSTADDQGPEQAPADYGEAASQTSAMMQQAEQANS
jgi:hypothetical protein